MKYRFGSAKRDAIWSMECNYSHTIGRGYLPICPHCELPVQIGQAWDISHVGRPAALGGQSVVVGHRSCNREDGAKVVVPMVAKAKAQRRYHIGASGPGLGKAPMPAGRRSSVSKTFAGAVVRRLTLGEKIAAMRAKRSILPVELDHEHEA